MSIKLLIFSLIFILQGSLLRASEVYPFFRDIREEGMGGAGVAVVDDQTALFVNPAGLGKIRGPYFTIVNPQIEMNYDLNSSLGTSLKYQSLQDPQAMLNLNKQSPDKHFHAGAQLLPSFVTTNFGIGAYARYSVDTDYTSSTDLFNYNYTNDEGAVLGYCFRLFEGRLKIGATGKLINRVQVAQTFPGTTTGLTMQQIATEGTGVGWDGGVLLTAPWDWLPTLGISAHDIGNTKFNLGNGLQYKTGIQPGPQMQMVNAAIGIFPIHSNHVRSSFTIEYQDLQNPQTLQPMRPWHGGVEFNFGDILNIRGGFNEGYYTAGIELDFGHNQFQAATYGEEIGTATVNREDRRFVFEYSFRL
jgi:hypothetical protein